MQISAVLFQLRKYINQMRLVQSLNLPKSQDLYENIIDNNNNDDDVPANWGAKTSFISLMQFYDDKKKD
jgi:hypothetical protein